MSIYVLKQKSFSVKKYWLLAEVPIHFGRGFKIAVWSNASKTISSYILFTWRALFISNFGGKHMNPSVIPFSKGWVWTMVIAFFFTLTNLCKHTHTHTHTRAHIYIYMPCNWAKVISKWLCSGFERGPLNLF